MSDKPKKKVPTKEHARSVWENMKAPSSRKLAEALKDEGYKVSKRNMARWKANDWRESAVNSKPLAEKGTVRGVAKALREELKKVPAATVAEADKMADEGGIESAMSGGKLTVDDYERIEKRIAALSAKTREDLLADQEKARIVMNVVLMEEAARRAHVMVLIPKETGSFVKDTNESAGTVAPVAPDMPPPRNGDDAKLIEGRVNEQAPLSPFSLAIRRLKEEAA